MRLLRKSSLSFRCEGCENHRQLLSQIIHCTRGQKQARVRRLGKHSVSKAKLDPNFSIPIFSICKVSTRRGIAGIFHKQQSLNFQLIARQFTGKIKRLRHLRDAFYRYIWNNSYSLDNKHTAVAQEDLPVHLGNCPIADSVVETRFTTKLFPQAVFGIAYEKLRDLFPTVEPLPITQLPAPMLQGDPNFKFKPHYRLKNNQGFLIQIGPDVLSVSPVMPYPGWSKFRPVIEETFSRIFDAGLFDIVLRIGLRYTNFFEGQDILNKTNLKIAYDKKSITFKNSILRTELEVEGFLNILQISNAASLADPKGVRNGSIIDVDTISEYNGRLSDRKYFMDLIEKAHAVEKRVFWDLLNDQLKRELNPSY